MAFVVFLFLGVDKSDFSCYTVNTDNTDDTANTERSRQMIKLSPPKRDVYLEIAERYEKFIAIGVIKPGEKLPSVRIAATEHRVNPNTVQKAYTYLEEKGLIRTMPKKGAYVKGDEEITGTYINNEEKDEKERHVSELILSLKDEGVEKDALLKIIEEVYR